MFGLSASHLLLVAIVALIFGGKRLPELGSGMGKGIRAFKAALEGQALADDDQPNRQKVTDERTSRTDSTRSG